MTSQNARSVASRPIPWAMKSRSAWPASAARISRSAVPSSRSSSCIMIATRRSSFVGKCRKTVPLATPARWAISLIGTSTPHSAKASVAARRSSRRLRTLSALTRSATVPSPASMDHNINTEDDLTVSFSVSLSQHDPSVTFPGRPVLRIRTGACPPYSHRYLSGDDMRTTLDPKVALVTGASSGIGRATALALSRREPPSPSVAAGRSG